MNKNKDMDFTEFLETLHEEGLMTYGITYYENLEHLRELKKYKEMWKELDEEYGWCTTLYRGRLSDGGYTGHNESIKEIMNRIEQEYFSKDKKLIELERLFTKLRNEVKRVLDGI